MKGRWLIMKMVMHYKGFKIKETTDKERAKEEGLYKFYIYKDGEEEWTTDNLKEALEFIDCY